MEFFPNTVLAMNVPTFPDGSRVRLLLDAPRAAALADTLDGWLVEQGVGTYDEPETPATFTRPSVEFVYVKEGESGTLATHRQVVPVTIKQGQQGILLVALEVEKGGIPQPLPVKTYRMEGIRHLMQGEPIEFTVGTELPLDA